MPTALPTPELTVVPRGGRIQDARSHEQESGMNDATMIRQAGAELPSARQIARRLAGWLAVVAVGAFAISALPGLDSVTDHFKGADGGWIAALVALEIGSTVAFAVAFHGIYERRASARTSTSLSMAVQGLNILLPSGGSGGLAVGAVILERAGVPRAFVASRTVALFLVTSFVTFVAIAIAGLAVATGLLPGDVPLVAALGPAVGALVVMAGVAALPRLVARRAEPEPTEPRGRVRRLLAGVRSHGTGGIATTLEILRSGDRLVIGGAIGYFALDVAALGASFQAIGAATLPVGVFILAYTLGHAGAMVPLPGSAEGGLVGVFVLYGASLTQATAAVLAYRVIQSGVPILLGIAGIADVRRRLRGRPLRMRFADAV